MLIELDAARERIKPLERLLIESLQAGTANWRELVEDKPHLALPLDPTARANFIHCHIRAAVDGRIDGGADGVTVNEGLGFFALLLPPDILLRFKYVGQDGTPQNVTTEQQRLLAQQSYNQAMLNLLGGDGRPPTLLTCGYTLADLDIDRIEIRCDCVGRLPWSYDIFGGDAFMEPLVFPDMPHDPKPARVTSSRQAQRKDDEQAELS